MSKRIVFGVLAAMLVAVSFVGCSSKEKNEGTGETAWEDTSSGNEAAPNMDMVNNDGSSVALNSFFKNGKPTVVNFWTSASPESVAALPEFQKAYEEMGNEVNFVMVNVTKGENETEEAAKKCIADGGYTFTVLYDTKGEAASKYNVVTVPETFFINAKGEVVSQGSGQLDVGLIKMGIGLVTGK